MATYEYICEVCSEMEVIERSITDTLARVPYCPKCTIPMRRTWSPIPAIFKGTGWGGSK